jgi:hypothetical protein
MTLTGLARRISALFTRNREDNGPPTHYLYANWRGHVIYPSGEFSCVPDKIPFIHVYDRVTGEEIPDVVWCDVRVGELEKYQRNRSGNLVIQELGDKLATEVISGKFSIRKEEPSEDPQ